MNKLLHVYNEKVSQIKIIDGVSCQITFDNSQNADRCSKYLENLEISSRVDGGTTLGYQICHGDFQKDNEISVRGNIKTAMHLMKSLKYISQDTHNQVLKIQQEIYQKKRSKSWSFKNAFGFFNRDIETVFDITQPLIKHKVMSQS